MNTIRESDIPTCNLIGITEVVAVRPDGTDEVEVWQPKRIAPFTGSNVPGKVSPDRPLRVLIDEPITDEVAVRVKSAIEKRYTAQMRR